MDYAIQVVLDVGMAWIWSELFAANIKLWTVCLTLASQELIVGSDVEDQFFQSFKQFMSTGGFWRTEVEIKVKHSLQFLDTQTQPFLKDVPSYIKDSDTFIDNFRKVKYDDEATIRTTSLTTE